MKKLTRGETMSRLGSVLGAAVAALVMTTASAGAQEVKHYRFAYDQPKITGYGILGDIFSEKLKALSKGTMQNVDPFDRSRANNFGR